MAKLPLLPRLTRCLALLVASVALAAFAQDAPVSAVSSEEQREMAYTKAINERADKIAAALSIADAAQAARVQRIITQQYRDLRAIHDARDARIKAAKNQHADKKEAADMEIKAASEEAKSRLDQLHKAYLAMLSAELAPEQVDKVKDGMTYGVLPLTYRVYLEMLPNLSNEQKAQIKQWLTEARENAMDAGSSQEKHAWFGKYKGRINNYLAAAGIDMKQAEKDMAAREKFPPQTE
jgi:multidrug efflux pump subunit AcrA (membrane-fusion protein)